MKRFDSGLRAAARSRGQEHAGDDGALARSLARSNQRSFAVSISGFNLPPAMTIACAIVLQVKEYFYRLGNNSTGLGEKQTLSNE